MQQISASFVILLDLERSGRIRNPIIECKLVFAAQSKETLPSLFDPKEVVAAACACSIVVISSAGGANG